MHNQPKTSCMNGSLSHIEIQLLTCKSTSCLPDDVCISKKQFAFPLDLLSVVSLFDTIGCLILTTAQLSFIINGRI